MSSPIGLTLSPLLQLASFQTRNLSAQHGFLRQKSPAIGKQFNVSTLSLFKQLIYVKKEALLTIAVFNVLKQTKGLFQNSVSRGRSGRRSSQARATTSNQGCRARGSNGHKPKEGRVEA